MIARCSCGRSHTLAEWDKLPLVGVMDADGEKLEQRNCECGSTISILLVDQISEDNDGKRIQNLCAAMV